MPLPVTTFAAVPLPREPKGTPGHSFNTSDAFIVTGAAIGVALVLVVWIAFFRKKGKPEYAYPASSEERSLSRDQSAQKGERRRRRKRRRVREHRPRNPTLDKTGGLPPPRPEDQPPPY